MPTYRSASGRSAEDLFIELFSDTFGAEKEKKPEAYYRRFRNAEKGT